MNFNRKLIFIEPYVSIGAHNYKHFTMIPPQCEKRKLNYVFLTEKNAPKNKSKNIDRIFTKYSEFRGMEFEEYCEKRYDEYKNVILSDSGIFIFLTALAYDFKLFLLLLKDSDVRKSIKKSDSIVILQSAATVFMDMINVDYQTKKYLNEMKNHIFFGYYSEFLAEFANSLVKEMNNIHFILPAYDYFFNESSVNNDGKYITYLGRYEGIKGPHMLLPAVEEAPDENYQIHFYPINNLNFLLYNRLSIMESKKFHLYCHLLSKDEYLNIIKNTKIGIVPYDEYCYSIRASGVLEEYMLTGVPVLVPKDTWLHHTLVAHNGAGEVYRHGDCLDFRRALRKILSNYDFYVKKARENAANFYHSTMSFDSFLEQLRQLLNKRSEFRKQYPIMGSERSQNILLKGKTLFYTNLARKFLADNDKISVRKFVKKAKEFDSKYWLTYEIENQIEDNKKNPISLIRFFDEMEITPDPVYYLNQIANFLSPLDFKEESNFFKKTFFKSEVNVLISVLNAIKILPSSELEEMLESNISKLIKNNIIDRIILFYLGIHKLRLGKKNEAIRLFRSFFDFIIKKKFKRNLLYDLLPNLSLMEELKKLNSKEIKNKAFILIDKLSKIPGKTMNHKYNVASLSKQLGNYTLASKLFRFICRNTDEERLKSGAFFHLGEIEFLSNNMNNASKYFLQCMKLNPFHQKAQNYLQKIKN